MFPGAALQRRSGQQEGVPGLLYMPVCPAPSPQGSAGAREGSSPSLLRPRAPSAVCTALRWAAVSSSAPLLSFSRPGNKTPAVQSCDRSQQRPLHCSVTVTVTVIPSGLQLREKRAAG